MAAATAMRIHVEVEKQLNSTLQFQLANKQRLAADLGRSGFFTVLCICTGFINADPDPAFHPIADPDADPDQGSQSGSGSWSDLNVTIS
jgi:hypothetical protein